MPQKSFCKSFFIILVLFLTGEASAKTSTIFPREKSKVPFSMAIGDVELRHE